MKNRSLFREIKKGVFALIVFIVAVAWICIPSYAGGKLQTSLVCMINNEYMAKEQIPTVVNGKTYYGCCPACAEKLSNNHSTRSAKDPYSGEEVDKADAFIALKPNSKTEVHYFKSEQNYINYVNSCSANNLRKLKNEE